VRPFPDELALILRAHLEVDRPPLDPHHLGGGLHAHPHGSGRDVRDVEVRAQALVLLGQRLLDRRERRRLDEVDHHRRCEHADAPAADARCGVLLAHHQLGHAGEAGGQVEDQRHQVTNAMGTEYRG